ncbi:MAG: alpha/beta hydrolase [Rickettsiaceae bacterium]|nr:MAG: alpha/beta hydrolase [Rickettsiaceae bacterium]
MIDELTQKLELFFEHYKKYKYSSIATDKYIHNANKIFTLSLNYQLIIYKKKQVINEKKKCDSVFLIIPSIFNSPEILFINPNISLIEYLRSSSDIYLINWLGVVNESFSLENYVLEVINALQYIYDKGVQIDVIGHCIGGTIALGAAILQSSLVKTLTLLTTPWDFSHFATKVSAYQQLNVESFKTKRSFLPKIYMPILFFLLAPQHFSDKISKYFTLEFEQDKTIFFEIERWLFSGNHITSIVYSQITDQLVKENILVNEKWRIKNKIISPTHLDIPVFMLGASEDKLVPTISMNYLKNSIKDLTYFEIKGGHISYIVGNKIEYFIQIYKNWLKKEEQSE